MNAEDQPPELAEPAEPQSPPGKEPPPAPDTPRARLRRLRNDLSSSLSLPSAPPPFSRLRWLRLVGYAAICLVAINIALAVKEGGKEDYHFNEGLGVLTGYPQGVALVLALWRPGAAWALSLASMVFAAVSARPALVDAPLPGPPWPWNLPEIYAHALVFLLLALRTRTRVSVGALVVTGLTTYVIQTFALKGIAGSAMYGSLGAVAVAIFAAAALVGAAFRGRREARTKLVQQERTTAEERARRALLEERGRIARELHDVVAHHMSVISIQAQVAPHLVENPSEDLKENLGGIRQNALEALTELRHMLSVLRSENPEAPYGLAGPGTGPAPDAPQPTLNQLDALIANTRAAGLHVVTDIEGGAPPYPPGVELSAYRIVQEALSNALRHAPGSTVRVQMSHSPHSLHLEVTNSRPQHPVPLSPGGGHGLLGMRERATMLGGRLTAARTEQGGFTVSALLPRNGHTSADAPPAGPAPLAGEHRP